MEETGHWWSSGARTLCPDVWCFTLMGHGVYGMAAWRHLGHALEMTRGVASGISKAQAEGERYPVKLRSWPEMPPGPARDPGQEWAGSLEMVQGVSGPRGWAVESLGGRLGDSTLFSGKTATADDFRK